MMCKKRKDSLVLFACFKIFSNNFTRKIKSLSHRPKRASPFFSSTAVNVLNWSKMLEVVTCPWKKGRIFIFFKKLTKVQSLICESLNKIFYQGSMLLTIELEKRKKFLNEFFEDLKWSFLKKIKFSPKQPFGQKFYDVTNRGYV